MAILTIQDDDIDSGNEVKILSNDIVLSGNKNNSKQPNTNTVITEIQTNTHENLSYNITNIYVTGEDGTFTWEHAMILYKKQYDGTNYSTLHIEYSEDTEVTGLNGSSDIRVVMDSVRFKINVADSKDGYLPMITMTFSETA